MLLPLLRLKLEKSDPSEAILARRVNRQVPFGLPPELLPLPGPLEVFVVEVVEVRSDELEADRH